MCNFFLTTLTLPVDSEYKPADLPEVIERIRKYAPTVSVPEFVPKKMNIITDEKVTKKEEEYTDEDEIVNNQILSKLPVPEVWILQICTNFLIRKLKNVR